MEKKVQKLLHRLDEVEQRLGDPDVLDDRDRYRKLSQEYAYLTELKQTWADLVRLKKELQENQELLNSGKNPELQEILEEEIASLSAVVPNMEQKLEDLLVPPDPNDHQPTILELRAGTGGDEAALFVGDCVRMYKLFADRMGWTYDVLATAPSEIGGFKEYVMVLSGPNVYRSLQYEAGTHRVQRVPATETQGRVHTSAITVAVLLEPSEGEEIQLNDKDLRIDTYRASGAGGQHINTTDSAVRITHIPSGVVVYCQDERSQHKNKDKAMRHMKAKLAEMERSKQQAEIDATRLQQVGSGDRSERIRTYNFSQNRLTDHRVEGLTFYNLDQVMNGQLESVVTALVAHFRRKRLDAS